MSYLAIVSVENNRIAKYQEFDTQPEADAHISTYGGFVAQRPVTGSLSYWVVDEVAKTITHDSVEESSYTAMRDWANSMTFTDATCPRWFEDYVTENNITLAPGRVKDNYDAKVALRATIP